ERVRLGLQNREQVMTRHTATRQATTKNQTTEQPEKTVVVYDPPLKPRRALVWLTAGIIILWITALLVMYFTMVYPQRHGPNAKPEIRETDPADRGLSP